MSEYSTAMVLEWPKGSICMQSCVSQTPDRSKKDTLQPYLPASHGDSLGAHLTEQKLVPQGLLVNHVDIVWCSLVTHAPIVNDNRVI